MKKGMIFDIQRASAVDGPGIRTTVFFKGCNLHCAWCHNPESQHPEKQMLYYRDKCSGCGKCASLCPHGLKSCEFCGKCELFCPHDARSICGREMTADEIMEEILRDIPYYQSTGGGATFSGGECMLRKEFLLALLKACREHGVHTAVDTAGCVPYEDLADVMPYTDLFLYDIKAVTSELHRQYTGADNTVILDNYRHLLADGAKVFVRVPMIAEVNANDEEFPKIAAFLRENPPAGTELLPYHALGENKYRALYGKERTVFTAPSKEDMARFRAMLPG